MLIEVQSSAAPLYVSGPDRRNRIMARMPWWTVALAVVPAALVAALAWSARSPLLAAVSGGLLSLPATIGVLAWRRIDAVVNTTAPVTRHWTITADEIRVTSAGAARTWRWDAVVAVAASPESYLMRQDAGIVLDLPRSAMTDAEDEQLRRFITDRGLL